MKQNKNKELSLMKKNLTRTFLLLVFFLLTLNFFFADIIPSNTHYVDRCVKITNINEFSEDYVIVGKITGPMFDMNGGYELRVLEENVCLNKGYKLNEFKVFAIEKNYFQEDQEIDFGSTRVFPANMNIEPSGWYAMDINPITEEKINLKIVGVSGGKLVLEDVSGGVGFGGGEFRASVFGGESARGINGIQIINFLFALILTLIIEIIVLILLTSFFKINIELKKLILVGALASILTLPFLWFVLPLFIFNLFWLIVIGELFVFLGEALIYKKLLGVTTKQALLFSAICNIVSFGSSFVIGLIGMLI